MCGKLTLVSPLLTCFSKQIHTLQGEHAKYMKLWDSNFPLFNHAIDMYFQLSIICLYFFSLSHMLWTFLLRVDPHFDSVREKQAWTKY